MELFLSVAHAAEAAHDVAASAGGISSLGIDGRSFIYQLINFVILLYLLRRFAFPPILKMLEERKARIEESLKTAQAIEERNKELQEKQDQLFKTSQKQAKEIINESREQAEQIITQAEAQAKIRADQVIKDADAQLAQKVEIVKAGLRQETAQLVARATEHIIDKKIDTKTDAELIEKSLRSAQIELKTEGEA